MNFAEMCDKYPASVEYAKASKTVLQHPHPALRTICAPITDFGDEVYQLGEQMAAAMMNGKMRGIGIAANQIGVTLRMILVDFGGRTFMCNPVILARSPSESRVREGCLSVGEGKPRAVVLRSNQITVEWQDRDGVKKRAVAKGMRAACIQHEIDHLDGVLYIDKIAGKAA